jgi:hypothetical protein
LNGIFLRNHYTEKRARSKGFIQYFLSVGKHVIHFISIVYKTDGRRGGEFQNPVLSGALFLSVRPDNWESIKRRLSIHSIRLALRKKPGSSGLQWPCSKIAKLRDEMQQRPSPARRGPFLRIVGYRSFLPLPGDA